LADFDFTPSYRVDFIFNNDDMNTNSILEIANLKSIWGQGVEEPLIAIERICVHKDSIKLMSADKNPTLKITLPNGMSLIKFRSSNEEYESLCSDLGCVTINIVGKCERNIWNGMISPQVIIEDYEIVGRSNYYF
jgi:single-stranded-DNA-specific exonuclease